MMKIIVNGLDTEVPEATTIVQLFEILEEPMRPDMILEINRRFIYPKDYKNLTLNERDKVEIIHLDIGG